MSLLYFDTSVIHPIAEQGAGGRIKSLLQSHGAEAFASIQNLVEAWRNPDAAARAPVVRALLQVARDREVEPLQHQAVLALVGEMLAHNHWDWLLPKPNPAFIRRDRARRRFAWERVRDDPSYRPAGMDGEFLYNTVGEAMRRQRIRRQANVAGATIPDPVVDPAIAERLAPLVQPLSKPEAYWRQQMGAAWWHGVVEGDPTVADLRDWLLSYLDVRRLDVESWMRFWLQEVDSAALQVTRVEGLVDYFQPDRTVDAGNWGDINHAGFAVGRDYLLTADRNFYEALQKVRQQPDTPIAEPILIDRAAPDIHGVIKSALGW
jgi:hypothetical protein